MYVLQLDAENDRAISEHVLRGHRFRKPGSDMEPEGLGGTSSDHTGQEEQTESPEEAAQVRYRVDVRRRTNGLWSLLTVWVGSRFNFMREVFPKLQYRRTPYDRLQGNAV